MRRYKVLPVLNKEEKIEPIPLTQRFFNALIEQQKKLEAELIEVKKRLKVAREMGDLSENGAYKYAKFEIGSIGRQLSKITFLLKNGFVAEIYSRETVEFGSKVTIKSTKGRVTTYQLLSEYEADPAQEKISMKSPLGQLLIGKRAGDKVTLVLDKDERKFEIISVD